ncbi:uncharacterized protein LOC133361517 isoform X3 [Lethenteron reissneri]|nr:uncharacterized protein LOC133361517 isoform X3 [Lethenteron reissneri]
MGFPQQQSEAAILEYDTVYAASEALLRNTGSLSTSGVGNVGIQNDKPPSPQPTVDVAAQRSQDSRGALGNSPVPPPPSFGQIHSIRILVDRKCAFVNYTDKEAAERALWSLQGRRVADTNLLIDFQSVSAKTIAAAFQQPSAVPPEHDEFTGLSP